MKIDKSEFLLRVIISLMIGLAVAYMSLSKEMKIYSDLIIIIVGIASFVLYIWEKIKGT